jgi:hypothetical protein
MKKILLFSFLSILMLFTACKDAEPTTATIYLTFEQNWAANPMSIEDELKVFSNSGVHVLELEKFKYYLSNVELKNTDTGEKIKEKESYHLINVTDSTQTFKIVLEGVEENAYNAIQFSIGVDSLHNHSTDQVGDLDPVGNDMVWNWNTGYKFLMIEGKVYNVQGQQKPFVYHIGTDANYRTVTVPFDEGIFPYFYADPLKPLYINISADLSNIFHSPKRLEVFENNEVMGDPQKTAEVMDNFANGVFKVTEIKQ